MRELPQKFQQDIDQKGFIVYDYISFWELMQTIQKDYLFILKKINIPFAILSVVFIYLSFESQSFSLLLSFFSISYGIIFIILFARLIQKTKYYFYISSVIFSDKGIIMGKDILLYSDTKKKKVLALYEEAFDEYLFRPSRLGEIIAQKQQELFENTKNLFHQGSDIGENFSSHNNDIRIQIFIFAALGIYSVFLFLFYFLGIFAGYIVFGIYGVFIKFFLYLHPSIELKIKFSVESLEKNIRKLTRIESVLEKKIQKFSGGEISDIAPFIGEKFTIFYNTISTINTEKQALQKIIKRSHYTEILNFSVFNTYIKNKYNQPVDKMIQLLTQYQYSISQQKKAIITTTTDTAEFSAHLSKKLLRTEQMQINITNNINTLEAMKIA